MAAQTILLAAPITGMHAGVVQCGEYLAGKAVRARWERLARRGLCQKSSNADYVGTTRDRFRITHPFHPLRGAEYELVARKLTWGEDRVFYYDQVGALKSFVTNVTDLVTADAFARISAGQSAFRIDDLLELRALLDRRRRTERGARDA
jgi:hypothetical protein